MAGHEREQQRTDTSASSIGGSLLSAMERNLRLEDILERQANETPAACLKRLLTTKSAISTSSSFAERQQAAVGSAAPFREIGFENITNSSPNFKTRVVSLWMLDFDACSPIQMDTSGVQKAIRAYLETEPACPRPNSDDKFANHLWTVFSKRHVETGKKITAGTTFQSLPQQFINGVELALPKRGPTSQPETGSVTASQQTPYNPTNPLRAAQGTVDQRSNLGSFSRYSGSLRYGSGQYVMGSGQIGERGAPSGRRRRNPLRGGRGTNRGRSH